MSRRMGRTWSWRWHHAARPVGIYIGTSMEENSSEIKESLDAQDGGIESLLMGPPLVGIFEIDEDDFKILDR